MKAAARHLSSVPYKRDTKCSARASSSLQSGAVWAACAPGDGGDAAGTWLQSSSSWRLLLSGVGWVGAEVKLPFEPVDYGLHLSRRSLLPVVFTGWCGGRNRLGGCQHGADVADAGPQPCSQGLQLPPGVQQERFPPGAVLPRPLTFKCK